MQTDYFQSKALTRDYASICATTIPVLDIMVARRSWRKYTEWEMEKKFKDEFEAFIQKSAAIRQCDLADLTLITDLSQLEYLFKTAYKGVIGKINPWLPKSKAAGMLVLAIDKSKKEVDRPLGYAYPTLVGQDAVLWLTEKGIGSVWLAGINGLELAKAMGLPSEKWIFAIIVFGKTGKKPKGFNFDNISYQVVSKKRKKLPEISRLNRIEIDFPINSTESPNLNLPKQDITNTLDMLNAWKTAAPGPSIRLIELEMMIEGGRIAPSACNKQPWQFVAINDENELKEMARLLNEPEIPKGMIACLGESGTVYEVGLERPFWLIDVPIAMSNISVMAGALGRSVKVYFDIPEKQINSRMKLKGNWRTAGIIGIK